MYLLDLISKMEENKGQRSPNDPQPPKGDNKNEFQWKRAGKTSMIWVLILMVAIFLSGLLTSNVSI